MEQVAFTHQKSKREQYSYHETTEDDFFYFYQEANGLNIFLHPVCYKFLKSDSKTYAEMPKEIDVLKISLCNVSRIL